MNNNNNNNFFYPQNNNNNFFQQPPQQQGIPGYGYQMAPPQYNPQNPYVTQPQQMPMGAYPQGQAPQPRIPAQTYTPQGAWDAYSGSIDADEKVAEMEKVIDAINNNIEMGPDGLNDADLAETLAHREFDAVLVQMEHLADVAAQPEKWFPKDKAQFIEKFKPNLVKLSTGLRTYISKLKSI